MENADIKRIFFGINGIVDGYPEVFIDGGNDHKQCNRTQDDAVIVNAELMDLARVCKIIQRSYMTAMAGPSNGGAGLSAV